MIEQLAGRRSPGIRAGDARAPEPGARLLPGPAGRADGGGRDRLVRCRRAARRRRLGQPGARYHRSAAAARARRDHHDPGPRGGARACWTAAVPCSSARSRTARRPRSPISARSQAASDRDVASAIWDLVWAGRLTNDTLAPLRTVLGSGRPVAADSDPARRRAPARPGAAMSRRPGFGRGAMPSHTGPPTVSGRWSALPPAETDPTRRLHAQALTLLDRYGILIRGAVAAERVAGGFGALYPVLRALEDGGQCRRGYFVEGPGRGAVRAARGRRPDARAWPRPPASPASLADPWDTGARPAGPKITVLSAADPASAFGAALPWPDRPARALAATGRAARPERSSCWPTATWFCTSSAAARRCCPGPASRPCSSRPAAALAAAVRAGALRRLTVERADGGDVYDSPLARALETAGFRATPRGLRLAARP